MRRSRPGTHRPDVHFAAAASRSACGCDRYDAVPDVTRAATSGRPRSAIRSRRRIWSQRIKSMTYGRGADLVFVAVSAPGIVEQAVRLSRPGARILLFSQTSAKERVEVSGADICVGERMLFGSYSASVDLQKESARLVFSGELPVGRLISHRLPLDQIGSGFDLARSPMRRSLKIIVQPQRWSW